MFEQTISVTVYLVYAAVIAGLMVCSMLSPIHKRSVDGRTLTVLGVELVYDTPPDSWFEQTSSSVSSSMSTNEDKMVRVSILLSNMPPSRLKRCMSAYLFFTTLCLLSCVALVVVLFVRLLPTKVERKIILVNHALSVVVPLAALLSFTMASVLGLQSQLYSEIAGGYYDSIQQKDVVKQLRSGFISTVVATFVGVLILLLSPVLWKS